MKKGIFVFSILILCVFTSSCTGFKKLSKIQATDYFSQIKCVIPLKIPSALPTSEFLHTNDNIEQLKSKLDIISSKSNNLKTEILANNALMVIYNENSKSALFLFHECSSKNNNEYMHKYRFSDFSSLVHIDKKQDDKKINLIGIPIPHYLFQEMHLGNYDDNKEYLVKCDIDEFYEFYKIFKKYYNNSTIKIDKSENNLILQNIPINIKTEDINGIIKNKFHVLNQVIFTFSKNSNKQHMVSIKYEM